MKLLNGSWTSLCHGPLSAGNADVVINGYTSRHAAETDKRWYKKKYRAVECAVFENLLLE